MYGSSNPICIADGRVFTLTEPVVDHKKDANYGAWHFDVGVVPAGQKASVVWHREVVLAWHTCEANMHHMIAETLKNVHAAIDPSNEPAGGGNGWPGASGNSTELPFVMFVSHSGKFWFEPPAKDDPWYRCHGDRLFPLFATALDVQPTVFFLGAQNCGDAKTTELPGDGCVLTEADGNRGRFYPGADPAWSPTTTHCFRRSTRASAHSRGSDRLGDRLLQVAECQEHDATPAGKVRVALVQREDSRRIVNADELREVAVANPLVASFETLNLAGMDLMQQLRRTVCGRVILVGVQGAGLSWGYWLRYGVSRKAFIELTWEDWRPFFSGRVGHGTVQPSWVVIPKNDTLCPFAEPEPGCCSRDPRPGKCGRNLRTKFVDVRLAPAVWKAELDQAVAFVLEDRRCLGPDGRRGQPGRACPPGSRPG